MTKLETLYKCRNIWAWLAITGAREKDTYTPSKEHPFSCPCCEHAGAFFTKDGIINTEDRDCRKCILNEYSWEKSNNSKFRSCEKDLNSFYAKWTESDFTRCYWAMRMIQACDRAIEGILLNLN